MTLVKCGNHRNGCTVTIEVDSAFTLMGACYAGFLMAHCWYCRACDEKLTSEFMIQLEHKDLDEEELF